MSAFLFFMSSGLVAENEIQGNIKNKHKQELTIAYKNKPDTLDPHRFNVGNSLNISNIFFDRPGSFDEGERLFKQSIAEDVRLIDIENNIWQLRLRKGVLFHDGHELTVDDFIYSVNRIRALPHNTNSFKVYVKPIVKMVKRDNHLIDIQLQAGYAEFAGDLTKIAILPAHYSHPNNQDTFNDGQTLIGTGTYKLKSADLDQDMLSLELYDKSWRNLDAIERVKIRFIASDDERYQALIDGDIQVANMLSPLHLESLQKKGFRVFRRNTTRVIFLQLDTFRKKPTHIWHHDGSEMGSNPLQDIRVRKAISLVLDRQHITATVMSGNGSPAGQLFLDDWPFSSKNLKVPEHNIERAKSLMKSAGYEDGFKMVIHGPRGRYSNDESIVVAIANMLKDLKIDAETVTFPVKEYFRKAMTENRFSINLMGWAPNINGGYTFKNLFLLPDGDEQVGLANSGRYSSSRLTDLIRSADKHFDQSYRNQLYRTASEVLINDVGIIPLHFQVANWGMANNVTYSPSPGSWRTEPDMFRWSEN
ncbi:ABC transporter substrate-binding protein [Veronia pacifica]|uniref:Solute-binding protein family 5 domain-containing protein n=2 Tax=Veronia pacifica TaxID=1080227 RepID=A0A1C3EPD6_9GAMM|nr:hypothetical protein A8L45_05360 [Veronia pacifica]